MTQPDWSPDRIRDRLQIQEVLYLYCRAIDRIQPELLASLFTPDALIFKGETGMPIAEFVPDFAVRHARVPRTSHMITSFLIEFADADSAFVEAWGLAVEQIPGTAGQPTVDHVYRLRYADVFRRVAAGWKIAERSYVMDHIMDSAVDPALAPPVASELTGLRNADDPAMRIRARLGIT